MQAERTGGGATAAVAGVQSRGGKGAGEDGEEGPVIVALGQIGGRKRIHVPEVAFTPPCGAGVVCTGVLFGFILGFLAQILVGSAQVFGVSLVVATSSAFGVYGSKLESVELMLPTKLFTMAVVATGPAMATYYLFRGVSMLALLFSAAVASGVAATAMRLKLVPSPPEEDPCIV